MIHIHQLGIIHPPIRTKDGKSGISTASIAGNQVRIEHMIYHVLSSIH